MSTLILWSGYGLDFERKRKQLYFILGVVCAWNREGERERERMGGGLGIMELI